MFFPSFYPVVARKFTPLSSLKTCGRQKISCVLIIFKLKKNCSKHQLHFLLCFLKNILPKEALLVTKRDIKISEILAEHVFYIKQHIRQMTEFEAQ